MEEIILKTTSEAIRNKCTSIAEEEGFTQEKTEEIIRSVIYSLQSPEYMNEIIEDLVYGIEQGVGRDFVNGGIDDE